MFEFVNGILGTIGLALADVILFAVLYRMVTGKRFDFGVVVSSESTEEVETAEGSPEEVETTQEADEEQIADLAAKVAALASEVSTLAAKAEAKK